MSKSISRELWRRFGKMYWPQGMDKQWSERKTKVRRRRAMGPDRSRMRDTRRSNVWDSKKEYKTNESSIERIKLRCKT